MEVLDRIVVAIFKSPQLRDVLLYTALLLICAAAWVSYRWPDLAIAAVVIACVLLGGGASLIYSVTKRAKASSTETDGKHT